MLKKLEITFDDGTKKILYGVESFTESEDITKKRYLVDPACIVRSIFYEERSNPEQEKLRKDILEAFIELDKHPGKYGEPFYVVIPELKDHSVKNKANLTEHAKEFDGYVGDWVEYRLELAQKIYKADNQDSEWYYLCNEPDYKEYYCKGISKSGRIENFGGSSYAYPAECPKSVIGYSQWWLSGDTEKCMAVPYVVIKKH